MKIIQGIFIILMFIGLKQDEILKEQTLPIEKKENVLISN